MFNPFKILHKKNLEGANEGISDSENSQAEKEGVEQENTESLAEKKEITSSVSAGNSAADIIKISTELDRVKASVDSFAEVRKGLTERISGLGEQIGELRAMIMDRDRTIQELELKAVKAADLVESVQPDKLMMELQKEDAKFEALKANLEGNEAIMDRIMDELREMRKKMDFFRGVSEIVKLSEEVKKELIDIKKVETSINVEADKVETIYSELRKKFADIDLFKDSIQELKVVLDQNSKDVDSMKIRVSSLATKDELDKLVNRVQRYIEALEEINKSSSLTKDVNQLKKLLEGIK